VASATSPRAEQCDRTCSSPSLLLPRRSPKRESRHYGARTALSLLALNDPWGEKSGVRALRRSSSASSQITPRSPHTASNSACSHPMLAWHRATVEGWTGGRREGGGGKGRASVEG
jgi:hypothetical protein